MKTLYHLCTDENDQPMEAAMVDGNGRKWTIPYDEPTEFESNYLAEKIVEHLAYYGMVEIRTTKTKQGITYDMDDARMRALTNLRISEDACINDYVKTQLQDRVRLNFSPLPPDGRSLQCVVKHKVNLLKFGIRPVGWEPPYEMEAVPQSEMAKITMDSAVNDRIAQLEQLVLQQTAMINQLTVGEGRLAVGKQGRGKEKVKPTVSVDDTDPGNAEGEGADDATGTKQSVTL